MFVSKQASSPTCPTLPWRDRPARPFHEGQGNKTRSILFCSAVRMGQETSGPARPQTDCGLFRLNGACAAGTHPRRHTTLYQGEPHQQHYCAHNLRVLNKLARFTVQGYRLRGSWETSLVTVIGGATVFSKFVLKYSQPTTMPLLEDSAIIWSA